ncbi:hypothetical protein, partial [Leclercia adecarboxylata]|uniref:hypothetical protein n=1 Tax=Leclercia adecarboxylata TaxID=83655 RepID=UPI00234DB919
IYFYSIGAIFVIGFFVCLGLVILTPLPQENAAVTNIMLGSLVAGVTTVLGYFYGSSKGSADKTDLMNKPPTP